MMLTSWKSGRGAVVLGQSADTVTAFPTIGVLEYFLDHDTVDGEAVGDPIDVARIQRPGVARDEVLDGNPVFQGRCR